MGSQTGYIKHMKYTQWAHTIHWTHKTHWTQHGTYLLGSIEWLLGCNPWRSTSNHKNSTTTPFPCWRVPPAPGSPSPCFPCFAMWCPTFFSRCFLPPPTPTPVGDLSTLQKNTGFKETVHVRICGCFCIRFLYTVLPSSVTLRVIFQSVVQLPPLLKRVRVMRVQSNGIGQILGWGGSVVVRVVLCVREKTTQTETRTRLVSSLVAVLVGTSNKKQTCRGIV